MAARRATPIVVGVGDFKNRSQKVEDAIEPLHLMLKAIQLALQDTKLSDYALKEFQSSINSIDVVASWTWPYADLPGLISQALGIAPQRKFYSEHGGNHSGKLFDQAARRISQGESKVAVLTGGEALASLAACTATGKLPPAGWEKPDPNTPGLSPSDLSRLGQSLGGVHSVGLPIHVYALYENAFRSHYGQSIQQNHEESAQLYAEFAEVAKRNPQAWNYGKPAATEETIGTVTKRNRMICFPYPLLMNAFNTVNLAAACLLTSTEYATELGIPESQWIYPLGGAGTRDSSNFWERPNYYTSPCISRSLDAGLQVSGLTKDQIDLFDFYSCFPIVPKLACRHLGMPLTGARKPITLLGGLTSFGGAGNNYSMHAITEMVRQLRKGNGHHGLVLANGGVVTYQHVLCFSSKPRKDGSSYPDRNPLPEVISDVAAPVVDLHVEGDAIIETYTVEFNRDGMPKIGHVVGRLKSNGHRFVANHGDEATLQELSSRVREPIGRNGRVKMDSSSTRNLFTFTDSARL